MSIILIVIGGLLIADTIFILGRSNVNMGVLMPALMGIPLLILGIWYPEAREWMQSGFGLAVKWILMFGYAVILAATAVCTVLITRAMHAKIPEHADAVIVLGAGVHGTKPSLALQHRLEISRDYQRKNPDALIVVSGGQGPQEEITEAEAMVRYLTGELGVSPERILREDRARSTFENFLYSKEILDQKFPEGYTAVFATNDFHVFRAGLAAKKAGFPEIKGLGCPSPFYIVPNYYLREMMAIVRYLLMGLR